MSRVTHAIQPPPVVLGIETSCRMVGVALTCGPTLLSSREQCAPSARADNVREHVELVLRDAQLTSDDIGGIAVSHGPGSFTGLRIGVSFVKGFVHAHPCPVVGVPTLQAMASNVWGIRGTACVVLDAKQDKMYAATFRMSAGRMIPVDADRLGTIAELSSLLKRGTLFLGDGLTRYARQIRRIVKRPLLMAPQALWWPRAALVAQLGTRRLARGQRVDVAHLTPQYLHPRTCSIQAHAA
jgi:tRNA threonylcarbamoyladenosine biosynthesis protein TsaB